MLEISKSYKFASGLSYEVIDENSVKNRKGELFAITKADKNIDHIKLLCSRIDMSEYILKPLDYIENNGFYYITRKIPNGFTTLTTYLENADKYTDIPFANICDLAINLIDNFQILHYYNLAYASISAEDIYVSIKTGQTLFGGCKRLQSPSEAILFDRNTLYSVSDTAAPVSVYDDNYAMFAMLFQIFYLTRPTEKKIANLDEYIFAKSSKNIAEEFINAFLYRSLYPQFVSAMFDNFFSGKPIGEVDAKEAILKLKYSIITCGTDGCRAENFYKGAELYCWKCGSPIVPVLLKIAGGSGNDIVLTEGLEISRNDIFHDGVFNKPVGKVVRNPKDKNMFGIKNMLGYPITFTKRDGSIIDLNENEAAPIALGITINFAENVSAEIMLAEQVAELDGEVSGEIAIKVSGEDMAGQGEKPNENSGNMQIESGKQLATTGEKQVEIRQNTEAAKTPNKDTQVIKKTNNQHVINTKMMELPSGGTVSIFRGAQLIKAEEKDVEVYDAE